MPFGFNETSGVVVGNPAKSKGDCLDCKAGHFCLNGTIEPEPCGKGKYTNPGQSVCQTCLAGRYCDDEATTETAMNTTKLCPAGKYCTTGLKDVSEATDCSRAHYCPEGLYPLSVGRIFLSHEHHSNRCCFPIAIRNEI